MKKILFIVLMMFSITCVFGQEHQLKVGVGLGASSNGYVSVPLTFDIPINDQFGETYLQVGAMFSHNRDKVNTMLARALHDWMSYSNYLTPEDVANSVKKYRGWSFTPMVGWQFNNKFCVGAIIGVNYANIEVRGFDDFDEYSSICFSSGHGVEYGGYFSYTYKLINFQVGITNVKGGFINIGVKM